MALLTRDAILSASDIKTEDVDVPEWGGTVRVKGLTAAQRDRVEAAMYSIRATKAGEMQMNMAGVRALTASLCIVDKDDKPIFTNGDDVKNLGGKSGAAIDRVFEVVQKLSGLSDNDIEELTKNSDADQIEGSPSA